MSYFFAGTYVVLALCCFFVARMYWVSFDGQKFWRALSYTIIALGFGALGSAAWMITHA